MLHINLPDLLYSQMHRCRDSGCNKNIFNILFPLLGMPLFPTAFYLIPGCCTSPPSAQGVSKRT